MRISAIPGEVVRAICSAAESLRLFFIAAKDPSREIAETADAAEKTLQLVSPTLDQTLREIGEAAKCLAVLLQEPANAANAAKIATLTDELTMTVRAFRWQWCESDIHLTLEVTIDRPPLREAPK